MFPKSEKLIRSIFLIELRIFQQFSIYNCISKVSHDPSTGTKQAQPCLSSVIGREQVFGPDIATSSLKTIFYEFIFVLFIPRSQNRIYFEFVLFHFRFTSIHCLYESIRKSRLVRNKRKKNTEHQHS